MNFSAILFFAFGILFYSTLATAKNNCKVTPLTVPGLPVNCPTPLRYNPATNCCEVKTAGAPACAIPPITGLRGRKLCPQPTRYAKEKNCCIGKDQSPEAIRYAKGNAAWNADEA